MEDFLLKYVTPFGAGMIAAALAAWRLTLVIMDKMTKRYDKQITTLEAKINATQASLEKTQQSFIEQVKENGTLEGVIKQLSADLSTERSRILDYVRDNGRLLEKMEGFMENERAHAAMERELREKLWRLEVKAGIRT